MALDPSCLTMAGEASQFEGRVPEEEGSQQEVNTDLQERMTDRGPKDQWGCKSKASPHIEDTIPGQGIYNIDLRSVNLCLHEWF